MHVVSTSSLRFFSYTFATLCLLLAVLSPNGWCEVPQGMVLIPAGEYVMGGPSSDAIREVRQTNQANRPCCNGLIKGFEDCMPKHRVKISSFWMDKTEVTNREYAKFVAATKYKTIAERELDPANFPQVPRDQLKPGSVVFTSPKKAVSLLNFMEWWSYVPGACWNHPEGPKSTIADRMDYPVVHLAYPDAEAFAKWQANDCLRKRNGNGHRVAG